MILIAILFLIPLAAYRDSSILTLVVIKKSKADAEERIDLTKKKNVQDYQ